MGSVTAWLVEWVTHAIHAAGYQAVVGLMTLESACIPLPSEIIMPFSGFLVAKGAFSLHATAFAGAAGCAVGSAIAWAVGYWGGRPFIERYGRFVLIRAHEIERADRWFQRYGYRAVFTARLLPIIRTFISLPAGIAHMPFWPFLLLSFVGSVPWCYFLTYVGFVLGEHWHSIAKYMHIADAMVGLGIVGLVTYGIVRRRKNRRAAEAVENEAIP